MRATIVPLVRRYHAHAAIAFVGAITLLLALRAQSPTASAPDGAAWPPVPHTALTPLSDAEPTFDASADVLLWQDAFDAPPSVTARGTYGRYLTLDARTPQFDARGGRAGSGALRMDWRAADAHNRACDDDSQLIEAWFPPAREIVVTYWVRYSRDFAFDWIGRNGPCTGNAKKLFLLWAHEGSRFVFISENGALGVGSDHDHPLLAQNRGDALTPRALADGAWHRITLRVRQGSSPTAADGAVLGWIDGVLRWRHEALVTHNAGGYYLFKMPATFNAGSPLSQSEWLDDLEIWRHK